MCSSRPSSLLRFTPEQAGANNTGRFGKYSADVTFSADNLAASKIDVSIDVASLDTGDKERDDTLKGADLFDVAKFPEGAVRVVQDHDEWVRAATRRTGKLGHSQRDQGLQAAPSPSRPRRRRASRWDSSPAGPS